MENRYTLGFRFVMAQNGRKRIECQVRCEVAKPLSINPNSADLRQRETTTRHLYFLLTNQHRIFPINTAIIQSAYRKSEKLKKYNKK